MMQERLAYSVDPPRQITVEISNPLLWVNLIHGNANMTVDIPITITPLSTFQGSLIDFGGWTGVADLHGTHPGGTYFQFRPSTNAQMAWENFALQIDVPTMAFGTPPGLGVCIIPAAQFGRRPVPSAKFAIIPAPTVEMMDTRPTFPDPFYVRITFPTLSLEWIEWSQTARYRAGNIVLYSNVYWRWDDTNPNAIYIGNFHIDLASGIVTYLQWSAGGERSRTIYTKYTTRLQVVIDDGDPNAIYFEPDLWW
jgi:hypothetical protein